MRRPRLEWIPVALAAAEGALSEKKVMHRDLKDLQKDHSANRSLGTKRVTYRTGGFWRDERSINGVNYTFFKSPDGAFMRQAGAPVLPMEGLFISIPEGSEIKDVRIVSLKEKELDEKYIILPAAKLVVEGEIPEYKADEAIYGSDSPFPGKYIEPTGTKVVAGRTVVHILIYPAQYRPKSKKMILLESIEFEIIYEQAAKKRSITKAVGLERSINAFPNKQNKKSYIHRMILDSEDGGETENLGEDQRSASVDTSKIAAIAEDKSISDDLPESGAEYLIITTEDLKESFDSLIKAQSQAWTVKLVTKEWITDHFGKSNKEDDAIKEFLFYASENWGTKWVILGGNVDKIPTHQETPITTGLLTSFIASDYYYADLKGDICPEITVSRFPASNLKDMNDICGSFVNYGQISGDWACNCLLAAYEDEEYIKCSDQIFSSIGNEFNVIKKYGGQSTKEEFIDAINAGVGILNYRGHGKKDKWSSENGLTNDDVLKLNNGAKMPIIFSIACETNKIDDNIECFGRAWVRNRKAIAFLGASRRSYTEINNDLDQYIFDAIVTEKLTRVGEIVDWAIVALYKNAKDVDSCMDTIRSYLLLGDPTVELKYS
jgi:hypothetical protein